MNSLQGTDWGNKAGLKHTSATGGNRNLNGVTGVGACDGTGDECAEILHGLNNVLASMLLNAQVLEWKLPTYSRSRRYLHEIERNAQRGGELVKQLLRQLEKDRPHGLSSSRSGLEVHGLAGAEGTSVVLELQDADP